MSQSNTPPAGWYADPQPDSDGQRWWDGTAWTPQTRPAAREVPPPPPAPPAPPQAPPAAPWVAQQTGAQGAGPVPPPYGQQPYGAGTYAAGYPTVRGPIGAWNSPADERPDVTGLASAFRTVFTKYAVFTGRASRSEFWYWTLCNALVVIALYVLMMLSGMLSIGFSNGYGSSPGGALVGFFALLLWVWELGVLLPGLAVGVRRLRDAGFHWALIFLLLIPILNFFSAIALIIMWCQPSKYP